MRSALQEKTPFQGARPMRYHRTMPNIHNTGDIGPLTIAPVAVPCQTAIPVQPEFIRLPKRGCCPWSGLTRSKLNELILPSAANRHRPPVKSACLRKHGAVRGVRLIHLASLMQHLRSHLEGGL